MKDNIEKLTNRMVIQSFIHLLNEDSGPISQDTVDNPKLMYYHLLRFRSKVISEKLRSRGYTLSKFNYQTIPCIPIDVADLSECPCAPYSGCIWQKTRFRIPTFLKIQSVVSLTGNIQYDYLQWDRFEDLKNSRFEAERKRPYYTLKNTGDGTYLYLFNDEHKEFISLTAIFEDPNQVYNFPSCKTGLTNPCFSPLDSEFILDPDLLPIVYDLAYNSLFRVQNKAIDLLDDKNDPETQSPIK